MDGRIYTGKPEGSGREEKEIVVYELLDELEIPYERLDHPAVATIEDCQEIDKTLGIAICKNLFLRNSQKTTFYLLLMPGDKKFRTKELSNQIGSVRLSFADAREMEQLLNINPGAVSVMGLMNDYEKKVNLLVDRDIYNQEYIGCHPCVNTATLKIHTSDVLDKFLKYTGHKYKLVEL